MPADILSEAVHLNGADSPCEPESVYLPGWPQTHYILEDGLELIRVSNQLPKWWARRNVLQHPTVSGAEGQTHGSILVDSHIKSLAS